MEKKRGRLTRYLARVEFIANMDFIDDMIKKGYPMKYIHELLVKEGKFTMAYTTFICLCRKYRQGEFRKSE